MSNQNTAALAAAQILTYLGFAQAVSMEPGVDRRRDYIQALIESAMLSKLRAPVTDERAAFEIYQRGTGLNELYLERHAVSGQYMWTATKEAWDTWQARAALASAPMDEPFDAEVLAERLRDVAANHFEAALGFGITQDHFERCAREAAKIAQTMASAPVAGGTKPSAAAFARAVLARYGYTPLPIADAAAQASEADAAALSTAVDYRGMGDAPKVSARVVAAFDKLRVIPILQFTADRLWVAGHSIQSPAQAAQPAAPAPVKDTPHKPMTLGEILAEYRKGCSNTLGEGPENCPECVREFVKALEALNERQAQPGDMAYMAQLRSALILARDSHGVCLLTDPPQDAWKARRVDEVIRAALSAQAEQS